MFRNRTPNSKIHFMRRYVIEKHLVLMEHLDGWSHFEPGEKRRHCRHTSKNNKSLRCTCCYIDRCSFSIWTSIGLVHQIFRQEIFLTWKNVFMISSLYEFNIKYTQMVNDYVENEKATLINYGFALIYTHLIKIDQPI